MAQPPPAAPTLVPGAAASCVTIPTAAVPPTTFHQLYQDATKDPYGGDYTAVMLTFRDGAAAATSNQLFDLACNSDIGQPNFYIRLYNKDGKECGRSYMLHGFATYPPLLGRPTKWDNNSYTFLQDVSRLGDIITVEADHLLFACTHGNVYTNVPITPERMDTLLQASPNEELLELLANNELGIHQTQTQFIMYILPRGVHPIGGQSLTDPTRIMDGSCWGHTTGQQHNRLRQIDKLVHACTNA